MFYNVQSGYNVDISFNIANTWYLKVNFLVWSNAVYFLTLSKVLITW